MFDIGISKIALISVVALVVLGPERLPRVARTAGNLFGRAQRYMSEVKEEVNRQMEQEELKKMKEAAIAGRKKARDVFDLWFIAQTLKTNLELPKKMPKYSQKEFENELKVFLPKKYYPIIAQLYAKIN